MLICSGGNPGVLGLWQCIAGHARHCLQPLVIDLAGQHGLPPGRQGSVGGGQGRGGRRLDPGPHRALRLVVEGAGVADVPCLPALAALAGAAAAALPGLLLLALPAPEAAGQGARAQAPAQRLVATLRAGGVWVLRVVVLFARLIQAVQQVLHSHCKLLGD